MKNKKSSIKSQDYDNKKFQNISLIIHPLYIEQSKKKIGNYKLYKFQKEFLEADKGYLFLEVPTGSGKTLSGLLRLIDRKRRRIFQNIFSCIIYPTNSLIFDQLSAFQILINNLDKVPILLDPIEIKNSLNLETSGGFKDLKSNLNEYLRLKLNAVQKNLSKENNTKINLDNDKIIYLLPINSKTLSNFSGEKAKGTILYQLFTFVINNSLNTIILTNIDFLFLLFAHKYNNSIKLFPEIFNLTSLIIDEFHLYSGTLLANLINILRLIHKKKKFQIKQEKFWIGFLSATPTSLYHIYKQTFPQFTKRITTGNYIKRKQKNQNFSKIRYETSLNFWRRDQILFNDQDLIFLKEKLLSLIKSKRYQNYKFNGPVKLLVIVNSVAFAEQLYQSLKKKIHIEKIKKVYKNLKIHRIHGLLPKKKRIKINSSEFEKAKMVLIGTRAIEIGIDFDVPFLVFEGTEKNSFFQRLGRGGRKRESSIFSIVPSEVINKFNLLKKSEEFHNEDVKITLNELSEEIIAGVLPTSENFINFLFSNDFFIFSIPFFTSLVLRDFYNPYTRKTDYNLNKIKENLIEVMLDLPLLKMDLQDKYNQKILMMEGKSNIDKKINSTVRKITPNGLRHSINYINCRSSIGTILVYFDNWECWELINLLTIQKFNALLYDKKEFQNELLEKIPAQYNYYLMEKIIKITGLSEKSENIILSGSEISIKKGKSDIQFRNKLYIKKKKILTSDAASNILQVANSIIKSQSSKYLPHIIVDQKLCSNFDWKLIPFKFEHKNGNYYNIYLGDQAFIVNYLLHN